MLLEEHLIHVALDLGMVSLHVFLTNVWTRLDSMKLQKVVAVQV